MDELKLVLSKESLNENDLKVIHKYRSLLSDKDLVRLGLKEASNNVVVAEPEVEVAKPTKKVIKK